MAEPASQNPYMYCRGNPLKYSDPSGYDSIQIFTAPGVRGYDNDNIEKLKDGGLNTVQSTILSDDLGKNKKLISDALERSDYVIIRSHGGYNSLGLFTGFENNNITYLNTQDFTSALTSDGQVKTKMLFFDACGSANIKDNKFFDAIMMRNVQCLGSGIHQYASEVPLEIIRAHIYTTNSKQFMNILQGINAKRSTDFVSLPRR